MMRRAFLLPSARFVWLGVHCLCRGVRRRLWACGLGSLVLGLVLYGPCVQANVLNTQDTFFDGPVGQMNALRVEDDRAFLFGHTSIWLGAGCIVEYSDNISFESQSGLSDVILRPNVYFRLMRPFTELNVLNIVGRVGTTRYMRHKQFNTQFANITPDTALRYVMQVGSLQITFLNRLSYAQDPTTSPLINRTVNYSRFENSAGLQFMQPFSDASLSLSLMRNDTIVLSEEFKSLGRVQYQADLAFIYRFGPGLSVGPTVGLATQTYKEKVQNDSRLWRLGLQATVKPSPYWTLTLSTAYNRWTFQPTGSIADGSQSQSLVYSAALSHRLSELTTHTLELNVKPRSGYGSNFFQDEQISYSIDTQLNEALRPKLDLAYQRILTSVASPERSQRYLMNVTLDARLFKDINTNLQLRRIRKVSNQPLKSYTEHRLILDLTYSF
jgi:hypothetical protein